MEDEGVGVRCLEALERDYEVPEGVLCIDGGTSGLELLPEIEGVEHLIVLDAIAAGRAPGTVMRLVDGEVRAVFTTKLSPHQSGIKDLLATLTLMGRPPGRVVVIGVEPYSLELSLDLSPRMGALVPALVRMAVDELRAIGLPARARVPAAA